MADTDDDLPLAEDSIPKEAISLTDAYECVVGLVIKHPELLPKFDEDWSEALLKSREEERKIQDDPEVFDKELEQEWHQRKEANLFLRLEIEAKRLVACTRDPEIGQTLQLRSDDWIPSGWDDYIPPGIWTDYIIPDDYEAPGPNGTLIRGALRPVFFMRDEFEAWLKKTFGATESIATISKPNEKTENLKRDRAHRKEAVKEAVRAIWGKNVPNGLPAKIRDQTINEWLTENGRIEVGEATIRRALEGHPSDRS
jgi:hypothetical protein